MAENDRIITIPSPVGGILYLDLDSRFLYEIPPFTPFGDIDPICRTLVLDPEQQNRDISPNCPGEMGSSTPGEAPKPHNHIDGVSEGFLRESVRDSAVLHFYALLGKRTTLSQFFHIVDYYSELLLEPGHNFEASDLNPDAYFEAADRRTPYAVEEDDSPATTPIMLHRPSCLSDVIELNVPFTHQNFGRLLETFVPPVDLGYAGMLGKEMPDSQEPYVARFPPSGIRLCICTLLSTLIYFFEKKRDLSLYICLCYLFFSFLILFHSTRSAIDGGMGDGSSVVRSILGVRNHRSQRGARQCL